MMCSLPQVCPKILITFWTIGKDNNGIGWGTANYHPGKVAGDLTDAGDVAIMLLKYLADFKTYDFDGFALFWYNEIAVHGYGSCNFQVTILYFTSFHFISIHFTSLHFTSPHLSLSLLAVMPRAVHKD